MVTTCVDPLLRLDRTSKAWNRQQEGCFNTKLGASTWKQYEENTSHKILNIQPEQCFFFFFTNKNYVSRGLTIREFRVFEATSRTKSTCFLGFDHLGSGGCSEKHTIWFTEVLFKTVWNYQKESNINMIIRYHPFSGETYWPLNLDLKLSVPGQVKQLSMCHVKGKGDILLM